MCTVAEKKKGMFQGNVHKGLQFLQKNYFYRQCNILYSFNTATSLPLFAGTVLQLIYTVKSMYMQSVAEVHTAIAASKNICILKTEDVK